MSWRRYFRRTKWDEERALELRSHMEIEADENVSRGMLPDEARFAANRKLGNATQIREEIYHMNSMAILETIWQDLRFAMRMLRKKPSFTIAAVLTLALGIGATTAIFSVVNSVLLRKFPYSDSSRVVVMHETNPKVGNVAVSYPNFLDWRDQSQTMTQMAIEQTMSFTLSGVNQPERIKGYGVSPNFLSLLGVQPLIGRDFLPNEEKKGTAPVLLLSYKLWQSHMGGDPNVVGRTLNLDGRSFSIVGVLPPTFYFLDKSEVLTPIGIWIDADFMRRASRGDTEVVARLAPGVTIAQARAEMNGITARLAEKYPLENSDGGMAMAAIRDEFVGDTRPAILVLFGAVMFVLLIACANVANLYLVRSAERSKEIAVRLAFGARRGRIIRQMLTESLVLAAIGGGLGILLGMWSLSGLSRLIPPDTLMGMDIRMDGGVFLFAGLLMVFVAIAFGLVPALHSTRPDVQEALKDGGRSSTASVKQHRVRGALAIAETALALVLLIGAGLMVKSLYRLFQVSPGIQPDRVLTMGISLGSSQYEKEAAQLLFWQRLLDRVHAIPGVESAAVGTVVPFTGSHNRADITFADLPVPEVGQYPHPDYHLVSADYLKTLGQPLLRGRDFTESDNESAPAVGLINSRLAERYFPNGDAIGQRFAFGHGDPKSKWFTIVGIVADTKLYGLENPSRFEIYVPYRQDPDDSMTLAVRSASDPAGIASEIRLALREIDKDQPVFQVETMKELVNQSVSTRHATLVLLEMFGALALVLAGIGIYGVMAYTVALRTHEIGIRMALGAQKRDVLRMVMGQGVRLAITGVVIGVAAALALTRLLSSLLYSVSANDPLVFICVPVLLVLVTMVACYIPAMRAMKVDPMVALRYE
jgi:putative ABC transport system permease protein